MEPLLSLFMSTSLGIWSANDLSDPVRRLQHAKSHLLDCQPHCACQADVAHLLHLGCLQTDWQKQSLVLKEGTADDLNGASGDHAAAGHGSDHNDRLFAEQLMT